MEQERQKFSGFDLCRTTLRRGLGDDDDDDDVVMMMMVMMMMMRWSEIFSNEDSQQGDKRRQEVKYEDNMDLVGDWWTCRMS